jgi:hypothetical protein
LDEWHGYHSLRWNRFLQALRRSGLVGDLVEYFRAVESQQRGALHDHALLRVESAVLVTRRMVAQLRRIAIEHGYGHELKLVVAGTSDASARLAAWYCAKYVSKSADERDEVPWVRRVVRVDPVTGHVRLGPRSYRTWTCSRRWGSSMRAVVAAQRSHVGSEFAGLDPRRFDPSTFWPGVVSPAADDCPRLADGGAGQGP